MKYFPPSELPINEDGSAFHLHLKPEQLADKVILVGDPARVNAIAKFFDSIECEVQSREFHTITGIYKGKRITAQSTGIGCDNIDITVTELDALANIDFKTHTEKPEFRQLTLIRIGTCGGLQPETPIGTYVASVRSIGFDGLLNYYAGRNEVCDLKLEEAFKKHMDWSPLKGSPYVACANPELTNTIAGNDMVRGITIACGGFYGPQGRQIRIPIQDPKQNEKVESFRYVMPETDAAVEAGTELKICNFEMESSALSGLSALLGHKSMTCCMVIANRYAKEMKTDYKKSLENLIQLVLERI